MPRENRVENTGYQTVSRYLYQRVFAAYGIIESEVLFVFAVIETGGKQYKVSEGEVLFIEKIDGAADDSVKFDKVLAISNDNGFKVGAPYVDGASVTAKLVKQGKSKKIYVLKYKAKKNEKKKIGHRQPYTKVQITAING